jgi:hypothetical protein
MVTVEDRIPTLNQFLLSYAKHGINAPIHIHYQGSAAGLKDLLIPRQVDTQLQVSPNRLGCHAARVIALQHLTGQGFDTYINVDDDVTLIPETNWPPAIQKAHQPGVGFVLTNWIKHPNGLAKAKAIMAEEFIPAVFVYNGGGMAYTNTIADLIRDLDPVPARFDDIWPLTAYLAGYRNYRYRGSLALHAIMGKGGMNTYMRSEPRPLLCEKWVNYRRLYGAKVGSDYSIPQDSDLKPIAREIHKRNRTKAGWS